MIKDTLYAKYILEREDRHVVENEAGFVTYRVAGEECFIVDMYIDPTSRRKGLSRNLVETLIQETRCKVITANIWLNDKNANNTLKAALAIGFTVEQAENGCLLIAKKCVGGING